jgi:hypothetical protein
MEGRQGDRFHCQEGSKANSATTNKAAISPASGSRPTTAEPLAPSPEPGQQGFEAVLSPFVPLCPGTAQDRQKLLRAWLNEGEES